MYFHHILTIFSVCLLSIIHSLYVLRLRDFVHMVFTAQGIGSKQPAWRTDFHARTDIAQTPFSQLCMRLKMTFLHYWQNKPKSQIKICYSVSDSTHMSSRVQGFEPLVHLGWKLHQIISQSNRSSPVYMGMKLVRKKKSLKVSIMML